MLKVIFLIVFCILTIVSYVFCKKTKDTPILSIIMAGFSVIFLITVIFTCHLIKVDKEEEVNAPVINEVVEDEKDFSAQSVENEKVEEQKVDESKTVNSDDAGIDTQERKDNSKEEKNGQVPRSRYVKGKRKLEKVLGKRLGND